jgi:hypothetical protein
MGRRAGIAILFLAFLPCWQAQMTMSATKLIEAEQQHSSSGTGIEPSSTPVPMLMTTRGKWQLMLHANAFVADTQQQAKSERGRDAFFSTNWIMAMAQHKLGRGQFTARAMFSLEPATVGTRNYPELFQQGETAYGNPIIDGQHPHDFFMELAAMYDLPLSHNTLLSFYVAPVGDPAIGPVAYPHRQSASEDPIAALGHHQEDSTHIAFNVVTGGLTFRWARIELSGFHGGEPTEQRWQPEPSPNGHAIDSVATRLTVSPVRNWTAQYSIAHIHSPEALYPTEDQQRQTASIQFHNTFNPGYFSSHHKSAPAKQRDGMAGMADMPGMPGMDMSTAASTPAPKKSDMPAMNMVPDPILDFSSTFLWGRTRSLTDNSKENSYLAEALLRFASTNYVWTRMENAGRSNELLLAPGSPLPPGFIESPVGHIAAFSLGYDHDFPLGPHLLAAPGMQFTVYHAPQKLQPVYGASPTAEVFFVRFRLR